jgi:NAD(P)H-hydrate epimerase
VSTPGATGLAGALIEVLCVSASQMRQVDEVAVRRYHVRVIQMMENAGRALADLVVERLAPRRVVILAGTGHNGGGGLVGARHLANRGVEVSVVTDPDARRAPLTAHQLRALGASGVEVTDRPRLASDVVIDALVGYSLAGPLRGRTADWSRWTRRQGAPVVALDLPTGLDATTGVLDPAATHADLTATLVLPKRGMVDRPEVGEVHLVDVGVPRAALAAAGLDAPALADRGATVTLVAVPGGFAAVGEVAR